MLRKFSSISAAAAKRHLELICGQCKRKNFPLRFICGDCHHLQAPEAHLRRLSYFELFEIEPSFDVDKKALDRKFKSLQMVFHPDRIQDNCTRADTRYAQAYSAHINEAYKALSHDLHRAVYLLKINGIAVLEEGERTEDPQLLEEMLEMNERIQETQDSKELSEIRKTIEKKKKNILSEIGRLFITQTYYSIRPLLNELKYLTTSEEMLTNAEERLANQS